MKLVALIFVISIYSCSVIRKSEKVENNDNPLYVNKLIENFKAQSVQNPPRRIYSFKYKNELVYFVPAVCCDQFSDLYDSQGKIKGHPDGGFSGMGDGLFLDFKDRSYKKKLIWEDNRQK